MGYENVPHWIRKAPGHLKTQEMCNKAVAEFLCTLKYVLNHLKTQEMCNQAAGNNPYMLRHVPNHLKTQKCVIRPLKWNHFY